VVGKQDGGAGELRVESARGLAVEAVLQPKCFASEAYGRFVGQTDVEITMADIRKDSPRLERDAIKTAGAMYNVETGVADFFAG
jgi:hypothetical protein